jgi:hypothetical protein
VGRVPPSLKKGYFLFFPLFLPNMDRSLLEGRMSHTGSKGYPSLKLTPLTSQCHHEDKVEVLSRLPRP